MGSTVLLQGSPDAQEIDVVVASDDHGAAPLTMHHVRRLETARRTVGERARHAKLLLFGTHIEQNVREAGDPPTDATALLSNALALRYGHHLCFTKAFALEETHGHRSP